VSLSIYVYLSPLEVHLLPSALLLEELLEWHPAVMSEWVLLLSCMWVVGIITVVVALTKFCNQRLSGPVHPP
jgi:hypothetical protein